ASTDRCFRRPDPRRSPMRRPVETILIVLVIVLAITAGVLFNRVQKTTVAYTDTKAAEQVAEDRYAHTINAIAEIQDSLNAISAGESQIEMKSGSLRAEQSMNGQQGREALDHIALLRAGIERNKARIKQLESSIKKSGIKVAGLQKMITGLKKSLGEKEEL